MSLAKLTPNLMVRDVNRTVEFYCDVLGFSFSMGVTAADRTMTFARPIREPLDFAAVRDGAVEIFFQSRRSLGRDLPLFGGQTPGGTFSLYLECDDLEARYARLAEAVSFLKDLHETFYGMREFYVQDPDGYVLAFAQKAQPADPAAPRSDA